METGMHNRRLISLLIAASLAASSVAFAQPGGNRNEPGPPGARQDWRGNAGQQNDRGPQRGPGNFHSRQDRDDGPNHGFRKGGRLPAEYRNRQYVVNDWRSHDLRAPPRGYHWVQAGGDYVLVAITTGIIMELLLNR
jgi:Ni/Co efflux regulator RcnB